MALHAGMSEVVITPPVGVRMSGYADRTAGSTGVLDQLYAKALVLDDGREPVALVTCDLLWLGRPITRAVREAVEKCTGIRADRVMVTATHTHCGPDIDLLEEATIDHMVAQISGAVAAAFHARAVAVLGFGQGACETGVNRRNPRSPRGGHFLYSHYEGAMDTRVAVLAIRDPTGGPRGALVNYACHPVTLGWKELNLSKDYVEYTCRVLKAAWGEAAVPIFLQGCAANVNPRWAWDHPEDDPIRPPVWPEGLEDRLRETRRLGHGLGGAALAAAEAVMRCHTEATLDARLVEVSLPLRTDRKVGADTARTLRYPTLRDRIAADPRELATQVQVLRVGPAYIVGLPGEVFVEYQMELREKIASPHVFVSELAGDSISYVTPPFAWKEGGYEPGASWVTEEGGSILVDAALEAIRDMSR